jgi:hypothetical protein
MSQQHYAVTGVSRRIGAEIAIGASVLRSPGCGVRRGAAFSWSRRFRGIVRNHGCRAPWRCRFITFVIMCYLTDNLA